MCGIAGIYNRSASGPIRKEQLTGMVSMLHHRGPDEAGIYLDDRAGLGSARLSIIDLEGGSQPISNEDESVWTTYNGEVYNYKSLRSELERLGHQFRTATDTEVVLHLYEEVGVDCLNRLNGQFAFAIWDSRKNEMFLARDRVGIRPLYYALVDDQMVFASEIKALFLHEKLGRAIDEQAMKQIFTFWTTLPGKTVFENVHALPPGHYLRVTPDRLESEQYWEIPYYPPSRRFTGSPEDIAAELRELLQDAVKLRLQADVPVGTYLSGGLDSSMISALAMEEAPQSVTSYGIQFEQEEFDESPEQKTVSDYIGTRHRARRVSNQEVLDALPQTLWHCEIPVMRTAPVPLCLLSRTVHDDGLKVVLTGEGADEVFGGYNIYREMKVRRFWARKPDSGFRYRLLKSLYPYVFKQNNNPAILKNIFGRHLTETEDPFYSHRLRWENTGRNRLYFTDSMREGFAEYDPVEELQSILPENFGEWDGFGRAQYLEMKLFMSNYLLAAQGDRVAMANSVEVRLPFLDHRVIDFAARIPAHYKIRGLNEKYILKRAARPLLPESVTSREKQPFRAPINEVLLGNSSLLPYFQEPALSAAELYDPHRVEKFVDILGDKQQPSEIENMGLIGILSSQILHERFIRNFPGKPSPVRLVKDVDRRQQVPHAREER